MKPSRPNVSPLMRDLSAYIASALKTPLRAEVAARAKLHLVDTVAAMISGSRLLPGKRAIAYVKSLGGRPEAIVMGTRIRTSAASAALANGMLAHADETDDTHPPSRTHPGSCVIPAAFAIGERNGLPGKVVLRGIVLGYEICARMLLAINESTFRHTGHFASSFGGIFGAAAAAGALLKFDERKVHFLLSYAAQQAAGLQNVVRDTEHIQKAFAGGGLSAQNGTAAALMVAHGFSGVEDVFSGERDFFFTFAPEADRSRLTRGLGRDFEIMQCGIKPWPAGGPIQAPMQILRELMEKHDLEAQDIASLVVELPDNEFATVNNREMPDICIQHLIAVMLLDGVMTFKSAHDHARMKDPKVLAVRKRVKAVGNPKLTDVLRRWRCVMEITLKDGRKLSGQTMAAKGTSENPLTPAEEEEKALDLIGPLLGGRRAKALLSMMWNFERVGNVRLLRRLVAP
jgi:2-methylcitrate dehydratase PrpD